MADGNLDTAREQLADRGGRRPGVDDGSELGQEIVEVGLVLVVAVLLAVPGDRTARRDLRVRRHLARLEERVEDVETEAIHAAVEPAPDHRPHLRAKVGERQFTSGCSGRKVWR